MQKVIGRLLRAKGLVRFFSGYLGVGGLVAMFRPILLVMLCFPLVTGCAHRVYFHSGQLAAQDLMKDRPRYPLRAGISRFGLDSQETQHLIRALKAGNLFSEISFVEDPKDVDVFIKASKFDCGNPDYGDWMIYTFLLTQYITWLPYISAGTVPNPIPKECDGRFEFTYQFIKHEKDASPAPGEKHTYRYGYEELWFTTGLWKSLLTSEKRDEYQVARLFDQAVAGLLVQLQRNAVELEN